ncbi:homeobox domain-domain-containing protein [Phakopsora pachyrhizi]|uniref:Homeobox domain-domain-containing protein n=1 Tax=Phakopsora pachyrhizi TaxID=170000 RepID=A0AAV0BKU3_PHAPC|nr:homeobox domain-domain-containing protein [Phakopsora pachyrhizi]
MSRPKRKRITPDQLDVLSSLFEYTDTPTFNLRETIGRELNMTNREVQVWFQNRRAKYNRQRLSNPQGGQPSINLNPVSIAILSSSNLLSQIHLRRRPHIEELKNVFQVNSGTVPLDVRSRALLGSPGIYSLENQSDSNHGSLNNQYPFDRLQSPNSSQLICSELSENDSIRCSSAGMESSHSSQLNNNSGSLKPVDQPYLPKSHSGNSPNPAHTSSSNIHSLIHQPTTSPSQAMSSASGQPLLSSSSRCKERCLSSHHSSSALTKSSSLSSPSWSAGNEENSDSSCPNPSPSSLSSAGPSTPRSFSKMPEANDDPSLDHQSLLGFQKSGAFPTNINMTAFLRSGDGCDVKLKSSIGLHRQSHLTHDDQSFRFRSVEIDNSSKKFRTRQPLSIEGLLCSDSTGSLSIYEREGPVNVPRGLLEEKERSKKQSLFKSRSLPPLPILTQFGMGSFPISPIGSSTHQDQDFRKPGGDPRLRLPPLKF